MTNATDEPRYRDEQNRKPAGFGRALGVCVVWYVAAVVAFVSYAGARWEDWFIYAFPLCVALLVSLLLIGAIRLRLPSAVLVGTLAAALSLSLICLPLMFTVFTFGG